MTKSRLSSNNSEKFDSSNNIKYKNDLEKEKKIKKLSIQISKLSYEDSLKELDLILNQLQNETLLVDELKLSYMKAQLYLEHCEKLLNKIEQEVIQIDLLD